MPVAAQDWDSPLEGRASPAGLHPHLPCGDCGAEEPLVTLSSFFSFSFGSACPSPGCATPWDTLYPPLCTSPASPGCKGSPDCSSSSKTPMYREHQVQGFSPNTTAPCLCLQPPMTASEAPPRAGGRAASHTGYRQPLSPANTLPSGNSSRGSSETHFSGSRQTLLLLPTPLGRQRHRAH